MLRPTLIASALTLFVVTSAAHAQEDPLRAEFVRLAAAIQESPDAVLAPAKQLQLEQGVFWRLPTLPDTHLCARDDDAVICEWAGLSESDAAKLLGRLMAAAKAATSDTAVWSRERGEDAEELGAIFFLKADAETADGMWDGGIAFDLGIDGTGTETSVVAVFVACTPAGEHKVPCRKVGN